MRNKRKGFVQFDCLDLVVYWPHQQLGHMGFNPIGDTLVVHLQEVRDASQVQPIQIRHLHGLLTGGFIIAAQFRFGGVGALAGSPIIALGARRVLTIFNLAFAGLTVRTSVHSSILHLFF